MDLAADKLTSNTNIDEDILQVLANTNEDDLSYPKHELSQTTSSILTKREAIRVTSSLFDPLGFFYRLYTFEPKCLFKNYGNYN